MTKEDIAILEIGNMYKLVFVYIYLLRIEDIKVLQIRKS